MITPVDLAAIKARLQAATPGPWNEEAPDSWDAWLIGNVELERVRRDWYKGRSPLASSADEPLTGQVLSYGQEWGGGLHLSYRREKEDVELIANAPTDIAALLAALEEARGLLAEARPYIELGEAQVAGLEAATGYRVRERLDEILATAGIHGTVTDIVKRIDAALGSAG